MKDKLNAALAKLWDDFRGFTAGQKAVTLAAAGALLIGGYLLVTWKPTPSYAPLYTNLSSSDASAIVGKLTAAKISYKLADGGAEIDVPTDKVDQTRLTVSAAGLPGSGESGYSLLDKEGVTTSQFKQQVDYQRAVEGELAKTIQAMQGVKSASVHLAIPQQDVFNDGTQKPTAAVLLTTTPGTSLTDSQVETVVNLVSSSVPGMTTDGVTVSGSNGDVLKAPGSGMSSLAGADTQAKATQAYNNQVAASIESMLDRAIGPDHAAVTVNSTLDFDQTKTTERQYISDKKNPPLSATTNREIYKGTSGAGGTLGSSSSTDSNASTGSSNASTGPGTYDKSSSTVDNALGTMTSTTENAPGQLKKLSIALLLDRSTKNLNVAAISQLVKSGVGFEAARGDSFAVQAMPFDNSAQTAALKAGKAAAQAGAAAASHAKLIGLVKQGVLVLLILILVIGAGLAGWRRRTPPREPDDDVLRLDEPDDLPNEPPPARIAPVKDFTSAAVHRRDLVVAADNRPQDVARVLSAWINTKETDR